MDLRTEKILKEAWDALTGVKIDKALQLALALENSRIRNSNRILYSVFASENSRLGMIYSENGTLYMATYSKDQDKYVTTCEFRNYDMNTPIEDVVSDYNSNDFCFDKIKYSYKDGQMFEHDKTGALM